MAYSKPQGIAGFINMFVLPGLAGMCTEIFFFSILPEIFHYSVKGVEISRALAGGFRDGFAPYLAMMETHSLDYGLLGGPAIGFVVGVLFWMMYSNDEV